MVGKSLQTAIGSLALPVASRMFKTTGLQFFMGDIAQSSDAYLLSGVFRRIEKDNDNNRTKCTFRYSFCPAMCTALRVQRSCACVFISSSRTRMYISQHMALVTSLYDFNTRREVYYVSLSDQCFCFQKLNEILIGYFDPKNIVIVNENENNRFWS